MPNPCAQPVPRPRCRSRLGEAAALLPDLERIMNGVVGLTTEGYVDGGDILCCDHEVMIGLSARTTRQAALIDGGLSCPSLRFSL